MENLGKLAIIAINKPKNFFRTIVTIFKSKTAEGGKLDEFSQLKKYFEVQLFLMFLKEDGSIKTLYLSQALFPTKMYMNVCENYLSLIEDIQLYSKMFGICNISPSVMELQSMLFLVACAKINSPCLRNWNKWVYKCVKQVNMKSISSEREFIGESESF